MLDLQFVSWDAFRCRRLVLTCTCSYCVYHMCSIRKLFNTTENNNCFINCIINHTTCHSMRFDTPNKCANPAPCPNPVFVHGNQCFYSQVFSNVVRDHTCSSCPLCLTGLSPPRKSADSECMWQLTANNSWFHNEANNWQMVVLPQLQWKHNINTPAQCKS